MIRVLIGDIFESRSDALVNSVNCVGVMGKGVALEFKKRYPHMFSEYVQQCEAGIIQPGILTVYRNLLDSKLIINFPTKRHWKSPTLLSDIEKGLDFFKAHYKEWDIQSVAFPPLGCGSGGLSWSDVGPLMYSKLYNLDIKVEIYAPFGTPIEELKEEFLTTLDSKFTQRKGRSVRGTLHEGEVAVLELLHRIQKERYAKPIGRVMFQKACYILTEAGVPTNMVFSKNNFGPFSPDAQHASTVFANNNLIKEERVNNMFKVTVTDEYAKIRKNYQEFIAHNEVGISKAADLLGRIKDTDQGEEVATIMYAARNLHVQKKAPPEMWEIIDYIFEWKKRWAESSSKKQLLEGTIADLAMLGWISLSNKQATFSRVG